MELTVDRALLQGVAAHNKGDFDEAELFYQAILKSQPTHADANHNLGLIAASLNKSKSALALFKTALDTNANIEQFWVSYIDALIKEKQFNNAKKVIKRAHKKGFFGEKLRDLDLHLKHIIHGQTRETLTLLKVPPQKEISRLLLYYQNGQHEQACDMALSMTTQFPDHPFSWKVLGAVLGKVSRLDEALLANQTVVRLDPKDSEAHYNLGISQKNMGMFELAEASYRQAIALNPNFAEAHGNLGTTLMDFGRLDQAETSYRQAISIKPDYAEAYNNLGTTLKQLGRLENVEANYRKAIAIKPDFAEAYSNLSMTLKDQGDLEKALGYCKKAILLNPDSSDAHFTMSIILYANGDLDSALDSMKKAISIDPKSQKSQLSLAVLQARKTKWNHQGTFGNPSTDLGLTSNPLIVKRAVEPELVTSLYEMSFRELDKTKDNDARYGNGRCSPDFSMFTDNRPIIKTLADDLTTMMMQAVNSNVYIFDSFFNILGAGGGVTPHNHITNFDNDNSLSLGNQKYSLVYYLSVGDQNCSEPGILKLFDPSHHLLPYDGMVVIIPSGRNHSATYNGKKDRIMIGVNFYSL